ncbi:NodA family N-acyltransferase [Rhizobium sp. NXC24]|uniref:NodA family N-acyltransferase n=1 Tax=Rhizobium sp. NXC24 TaxID=2048897 RepID=UPI000CDF37D7|nr:NodA family N-acyltransferase [Rhizobium sp. NXC24]AVA24064.1 nodulation protein NodA 2 [Rhizobium sp. NXC24]
MHSQMRWRLCWESDLELADHVELAKFFRTTYGPTGAFNAKPFEGSRSWAGARPELRFIGYDAKGIAAHLGVLRRFIRVGTTELLVAELGLYGVRPDLEGLGIGHSMRVRPVLQDLGVSFGFGTVPPASRNHIDGFGHHGPVTLLSGIRVWSTLPEAHLDKPSTSIDQPLVLIVPAGRPLADWPAGTTITRNGAKL